MKLLNRHINQSDKEEQPRLKADIHTVHHVNYKPGTTPFEAYLRVRPLFLPEQMRNPQNSIEVLDRESVIFKHEHQQGLKSLTKDKLYRCSKTVPPGGKTNQLLQLGVLDLVHDTFNGLNQALFVIGGKDSGKTHTFIGNVADPGLCFIIPSTIFQLKDKHYDKARIYISCFSFQNNFKDLLVYTGESIEHRTTQGGTYLPGLSQHECPDMQTYLTFLKTGLIVNGKRDINRDFSQAFTLFNASPEKEIFIIKFTIINILEQRGENGLDAKETHADLFIIDTESYESMDKIDSKGVNNAMLSFNNCMRTIYEINMKMREDHYVHYEQSPFTSYFREYLGGRAKTYIIGTVSPYSGHLEYSMRTVREVQWAFKSKSNGIMHQEIRLGKLALANEVGYLKIMHNHSVLISQEITIYLKRKNLVEEEEKQKYIQFLGRIFKKLYYINRICNEKIKRIQELRDQISEIHNGIIEQEKNVMKDQIRSSDVKEFFLIKIVPLMYNLVYSKIQKAQLNLQKKLKTLKSEELILVVLKKDTKDFVELFVKKNKAIFHNHQEAIYYFSRTFLDHLNWSLYNCFKSFNHPDKAKLSENKTRVEKTAESNFLRIFTTLNITDFHKFEDRSFGYVGIKLSDLEQPHIKSEKPRPSCFMPKQPSFLSIREKAQTHSSSPQETTNSIKQIDDEENHSLTGIKKQLSSIFDLPTTTMVLKSKQKKKAHQNNNSRSENSLEERDSDDEEESDEDNDLEVSRQEPKRKYMYNDMRQISKRVSSLNTRTSKMSVYSQIMEMKNGVGYYDDDTDLIYHVKGKKSDQEAVHIPRLNKPQITIKASKSDIQINRKLVKASSPNSSVHNSYFMSGSSNLPYINNNNNNSINQNNLFSCQTSEGPHSNRNINFSQHLSDTDTIKIKQSTKTSEAAYNIKDNDDQKMNTITLTIPRVTDEINEDFKTQEQLLTQEKQKLYNDDEYNEQNSLLNAINTQRNYHYHTEMGSDAQLNTQRSHLPTIQSNEENNDKSMLSFQVESMYYSDIQLKSHFNDKLVVNVNLYKNDLESYKLPFSIKKIFNSKSVSRLNQINQGQPGNSENFNTSSSTHAQQSTVNFDFNRQTHLPRVPPKNSVFSRQMQIAADKIKFEQSLQNRKKYEQQQIQFSQPKSIYYESLEALVRNPSSSFKKFAYADAVFDKVEDEPLFSTKSITMKEKLLMKRQFYSMRRKPDFVYKPNTILKQPTESDLDQVSNQVEAS